MIATANRNYVIVCSNCNEEIYRCEECDDYFKDGDKINCLIIKNTIMCRHTHEGCKDE